MAPRTISPSFLPSVPSPSATRRARAWLAATSLVLALGCDSDSDPYADDLESRSGLVGMADGTDVALGALSHDDTLAIYQCGGDLTFATHTQWFRGTIGTADDPDAFELSANGFVLTGARTPEGLVGEMIEPDGTSHSFEIDPVPEGSDAGVYVGKHAGQSIGVVVREEDGELVAQGARCSSSPRVCDQVIILAPLTIESGTIDVLIDVDGVLEPAQVTRTLVDPARG